MLYCDRRSIESKTIVQKHLGKEQRLTNYYLLPVQT